MNELGLTHIESLDSERVHIPGLDVEGDLEKTIALGTKKAKRRNAINIGLSAVGIALIGLFGFSIMNFFNDTSTTNSANRKVVTEKQERIPTEVKSETEVRTTDVPTIVNTPSQQVQVSPKYVSILQFGDSALCNPATRDPNSNAGIIIGPSTTSEKWNPSVNESKTIFVGEANREITITNVASTDATNGQYVNLSSGFDKSNSFADISTLGFTYCQSGYKLEITPESNSTGYVLNTIAW